MAHQFMAADFAATSLAFVLFALVALVPGYVLGWCADLLSFRRRGALARFVIAVPVSVAAFPILTFHLWRWSVNAVWALLCGCLIAFFALVRDRWPTQLPSRRERILVVIVAGWILVGVMCLIDLQIGPRLYFPTVSHDYMLRAAITSSITRSGVPPGNPYFSAGGTFPLRYHYFWFLPCSLVDQLGGSLVSARQAVIAGTLWCGIGLIAMVPLYLRFFQPQGAANLERRTLAGVALLGVTGLDLLPIVAVGILRRGIVGSIEWWNDPIIAWTHAVLWVPHHVAALIACLTGFLVIYHTFHTHGAGGTTRLPAAIAGGLMFASATGLSIYITLVFACGLGILVVLMLVKRYLAEAALLACAGIVALLVSFPYLRDLSGTSVSGAKAGVDAADRTVAAAGPLLEFAVRPFSVPDQIVQVIWPDRTWLRPITDLLLLPLNYFLELGLFAMVSIAMLKRLHREDERQLATLSALTLALTSVLMCSFLRSSVISNNDLGWRGFLIAQFILLIWAAELWTEGFFAAHARKGLIAVLLIFGTAGTLYEVSMVRFYTLIADHFAVPNSPWFDADHHLGERTYALRGLYEELQRKLPDSAVLQHNPNRMLGDVFHGMYADRQVAVETPACGIVFGGNPQLCAAAMPSISLMFDKAERLDWSRVQTTCRDLSIDAIVMKDSDPIWSDPQSWVSTRPALVSNRYGRAFLCADTSRAAR